MSWKFSPLWTSPPVPSLEWCLDGFYPSITVHHCGPCQQSTASCHNSTWMQRSLFLQIFLTSFSLLHQPQHRSIGMSTTKCNCSTAMAGTLWLCQTTSSVIIMCLYKLLVALVAVQSHCCCCSHCYPLRVQLWASHYLLQCLHTWLYPDPHRPTILTTTITTTFITLRTHIAIAIWKFWNHMWVQVWPITRGWFRTIEVKEFVNSCRQSCAFIMNGSPQLLNPNVDVFNLFMCMTELVEFD